jgi:hypothetical protein
MESHRSSRRFDDDHPEQQQLIRMSYQQQRHASTPLSAERIDSRRLPSPPRIHQQQQQHRQPSDEAIRRVSSGSNWADDDDGEMNFNEPPQINSNRSELTIHLWHLHLTSFKSRFRFMNFIFQVWRIIQRCFGLFFQRRPRSPDTQRAGKLACTLIFLDFVTFVSKN